MHKIGSIKKGRVKHSVVRNLKKQFSITIVALCLVQLICTAFLYQRVDAANRYNYYGILDGSKILNFSMKGHNGSTVELSEFRGKVTLITFGYTNCPDICPMTLTVLRHVMRQLGDEQDQVQVLFISIDPENDTEEKLKDYLTFFHPAFLGLRGTSDEIDRVARSFKSYYKKEVTEPETDYLKSHTFSIYLINKDGRLFLTYPPSKMDPKAIAEDIKMILK